MSRFRLIVVPYELGRLRAGVGRGPERLLAAGAERALAAAGAHVDCELVELERPYDRSGEGDVDACFALIREVAGRVRRATQDGAMPVVLSGSCFVGVGIVAGLAEPAPGVVWLDAHSDFNSPDITTEGYFDGMGLAVLTGGAWQGLSATVPGARAVPETAVVLAGARDFDPADEARLRASAIAHLPPDALRAPGPLLGAVAALRPAISGVYLHVDLDVLDASIAAVNVFAAPGGLTADELEALVAATCDRCPVRAISLTAYDPDGDAASRVPPIALRLLGAVAHHMP